MKGGLSLVRGLVVVCGQRRDVIAAGEQRVAYTYMGVCESVAFGGGGGGGWDRPRGRATCRALRIAKDHTCVYKYTHYHHPVACYALIHDLVFLSFHSDY